MNRRHAAGGGDNFRPEYGIVGVPSNTGYGSCSSYVPRPAPRSNMAIRSKLGRAQPECRGPTPQGAIAAHRLPGGARERPVRTGLHGPEEPVLPGDEVGLTQTLGWVDAWSSQPSAYAVAARTTADVVAAVNFARENNLRLVVKGGGTATRAHPTPLTLC